jgi:hypothetical protein
LPAGPIIIDNIIHKKVSKFLPKEPNELEPAVGMKHLEGFKRRKGLEETVSISQALL